mgnify:FL=1
MRLRKRLESAGAKIKIKSGHNDVEGEDGVEDDLESAEGGAFLEQDPHMCDLRKWLPHTHRPQNFEHDLHITTDKDAGQWHTHCSIDPAKISSCMHPACCNFAALQSCL